MKTNNIVSFKNLTIGMILSLILNVFLITPALSQVTGIGNHDPATNTVTVTFHDPVAVNFFFDGGDLGDITVSGGVDADVILTFTPTANSEIILPAKATILTHADGSPKGLRVESQTPKVEITPGTYDVIVSLNGHSENVGQTIIP